MLFLRKNKAAPRDFTEAMLPVDRKQMFFDCIRQRFDVIIRCGLILLAATLPLLIVRLWGDLAYADLLGDAEAEDPAGAAAALLQVIALLKIPCYVLLGVGFAAISRVLRQLIWAEPIFFFDHFKAGIKQNWKPFFTIFLLYGILNAINVFVSSFFGDVFLSFLPTAITLFFFLPIGLYMLSQNVIYNVTFGKSVMNGLTLYLRSAPFVWIFIAVIFSFSLIDLIPVLLVRILVHLAVVLILLPCFSIAWMLYSCHVFDKYVNPGSYPEIVGKGLYRPRAKENHVR